MGLKRIDADTGQNFTLDMTEELRADLEAHWGAECEHPETVLRRVTLSNQSIQYRHVCERCGAKVGLAIKKSVAPLNIPVDDGRKALEYARARDVELSALYQDHIRKQKESGNGYAQKYSAYLKSEKWAEKRKLVLDRAGGICEGCLTARATQVHHLSYQHVFDELLFELAAVCDDCHTRAHAFDAVTEIEHRELPCLACRMSSWSETSGSFCVKFDMSTGRALSKAGPCGPDAKQLEPLR